MKECRRCGREKATGLFPRHRATRDGLSSWCRDCHNEVRKEWRQRNPVKQRLMTQRWRERNRDRKRVENFKRRGAGVGFHSTAQIQDRVAYYGDQCWMCGGPWDQIDHVIPLAKGGTDWPSNLRPVCKSCNCRKKDSLVLAA